MHAPETGYFTEADSVRIVTDRMRNAKDERLKAVMEVVIRKLHEAVKEIEPTQDEWFEAIMFLTETGQMCDDWRQEYILLSDILGVSMLVDAVNSRRPSGARTGVGRCCWRANGSSWSVTRPRAFSSIRH